MSDSNGDAAGAGHPAQAVIQAFGGIRPMAHKLGIAVSTVQGWKERGTIPRSRHPEIQAAAEAAGLALDPAVLAASDPTQAPVIEGVGAPVAEPPAADTASPSSEPEAAAPPPDAPPGAASAPGAPLHPDRRPPGWLARLAPQLPAALLGALILAAGFMLAVGTSDYWLPRVSGGGGEGRDGDLAALERRLAELEARPAPADLGGRMTQLEGDVQALGQRLDALPAGGDPAALEALRTDLRAELQPLQATLDETRKQLADLSAQVATLPAGEGGEPDWKAALDAGLAELTGRVLALEATAQTLAGKLGALDLLDQRIADQVAAAEARLDGKLASALAALPEAGSAAPEGAAALALGAAALKDAVAAGRAYGQELALLRQLGAGDAAINATLDRLAPRAEQGLPTEAALLAAFPATAQAIVAAERGGDGGDWFADLWQSLGELVTVRPIGEVAGEDAAARVARAEQRLAAGDLAAAVAELEGLSGAPAEAAAPWLADARARLEGLAAADEVVRQALARLGTGG